MKDGLEEIMTKMNKEYSLVDLVIKDFEKYKQEVANASEKSVSVS